ncbi:polysaccharide biosynthesis protein [Paenibacillus psychroresistens]|uniref:Polysaccharide biosynthesis protein n=1 Tax=Paenibacillus psychroresistens TaxID=1778678 RepID=A0A6B8RDB2_9BACL|nr:UDP-N-acetylglucosamine 4,6-dehydratase family protein [Paenibacillus psychroresistens]QGQ93525.1 polysaccharide biosynthesis protein [Paenibacillus psychroresistens]
MAFFKDKKVLIIGGTGTIGQSVLRRILADEPAVVRILSRDEFKQFELQHKLKDYKNIRYLIGDIRDSTRVQRAMQDIDYVFHAAAMKHVPACEYNPFEAVQTNIIGTQNVILAAIQTGVAKVLFTSTDKAISPTNTYGATKLMAERLISAAEYQKGTNQTIFSSVRFGNVMGSRGSVIPLFKKQIIENRQITVTDLNMTRFMMTSTQAITLMLKANELALGGEVFVLKMPMVRMRDLAEVMIEEVPSKYGISGKIEIKEIGLRPGEKMYEELMTDDETRLGWEMQDMFVIPPLFIENKEMPLGAKPIISNLNSHSGDPISKETLRDWILTEQLI